MCLISRTNEPLIATEEIKIYKKCRLFEDNKLHSYFTLFTGKYHYSKVEEARIFPELTDGSITWCDGCYIIREGLHGVLNPDDLIPSCLSSFNRFSNETIVITEWIIPIGIKYYLDIDNKGIVAEKIMFSKLLTSTELEKNIIWKE